MFLVWFNVAQCCTGYNDSQSELTALDNTDNSLLYIGLKMKEASTGNLFFHKIDWWSWRKTIIICQNIAGWRRTSCDECILKCSRGELLQHIAVFTVYLSQRLFALFHFVKISVELTGCCLCLSLTLFLCNNQEIPFCLSIFT